MKVLISTDQYPPDTRFEAPLPSGGADLTLRALLTDVLCPDDPDRRRAVLEDLDPRRNPDLPECHRVLSLICDQWRAGLCEPALLAGPELRPAQASDPALLHLNESKSDAGDGALELHVSARHEPVAWACRQGYAEGPEHVWEWLQAMALLYLADRGLTELPDPGALPENDPERALLDALRRRGALHWSGGDAGVGTPGREVIAANLAETERLIDDFDVYSDARWNRTRERAEFGSGRGADLRVPVMIEHGVDPLRSVFLLRLYDGSLDDACDWREAVSLPTLEALLLPVVDRVLPEPPPELLSAIIADAEDQRC